MPTITNITKPITACAHTRISTFTLMSLVGVIAAMIFTAILLYKLKASLLLLPLMLVVSGGAFFFTGMLIKVITGKEDHVMLRYFIAVMMLNYLVLQWLGLAVFPALDILACAYGMVIFFGRFGCFAVGCCHGRPHSFGVCYSDQHVKQGFTSYYRNVRLFPIQMIEASGLLVIISYCTFLLLTSSLPGQALSTFIIFYCALRYVLEFFRGDPGRPYWLSFSEAQWTAMALSIIIAVMEWKGALLFSLRHITIASAILIAFTCIGIFRFFWPQSRINEPWHVKEIMSMGASFGSEVKVNTTSLGINISAGNNGGEQFYTLSSNRFKLDHVSIKKLSHILALRHPGHETNIIERGNNLFHIVFGKK